MVKQFNVDLEGHSASDALMEYMMKRSMGPNNLRLSSLLGANYMVKRSKVFSPFELLENTGYYK